MVLEVFLADVLQYHDVIRALTLANFFDNQPAFKLDDAQHCLIRSMH